MASNKPLLALSVLVFVAAGAGAAGWLLKLFEPAPAENHEIVAPVALEPPPPARADQAPSVRVQTHALSTQTRALPLPAGPPKSDGRTIEFEVVEGGLAVAYGDLILGKVESGSTSKSGRYEPSSPQLWEKPEIPYAINPDLPNPQRVEKAIEYFNQHTPVQFVPYANQADALVFEPGEEHCYSALGKTGGLQPIRLSAGCQTQEILHEMMHALGFVHEQSRPDRDQYVQVLWDNIEQRFQPQFALVPDTLMEAERDTPFDFHSIMLYRPDTFAAHAGLATLQPQSGRPPIAPSTQGLSDGDLQRLKRMYRL